MQRLSKSCQTVLFLLSILIEAQAMHPALSPSPSPLSPERAPCRPDQKSDLLHFLNALTSDNSTSVFCQLDIGWLRRPKMLSWNAASDCCLWDGVTCDPMTGHVTCLEHGCLPPNPSCHSPAGSSHGSEPSTLGLLNLPSPQEAERPSRSNKLLQNLTKLRVLILDGLDLSGLDVTRLSNLPPSLEVLSLCSCKLHGTLAANIFHLPKLTCLNLGGNKELSGYLPESTWNSSLKVLDLSSSGFSGVLPESIGDLRSLQILRLYRCNFTGSIPSSLSNLTQLTHLELSYNEFSGQVPPTLSNLHQLSLLDLSSNKFVGPIPNVFDNKTRLLLLNFSNNLFKGPIPSGIKNLSNLGRLDISHNLIGGFIPSSLFSLSSLTSLDLSNNRLSGHIGEFLATPTLDHVDLSGNQLRGSIPSSIFQLGNLTYLSISANKLTNVLDLGLLSRLKSLAYLDLSDNLLSLSNSNNVEDVLPSLLSVSLSRCRVTKIHAFLKNSTRIEWIDLSGNRIQSNIPSWMWDIGTMSLSYLNLSHNFLTSFEQVPWRNLIILDLRSNLIQGSVLPPSLPNSVLVFSLASNQLTGYIPGSICEMKDLQFLDLSHNNFTGTLPRCLENVSNSLLVLDLQENGLSGTISLKFNKNAALRSLCLNGNQFEGLLPRSLINCKQLEVLDLRGNKLRDTFPKWLETLPNLQSNRLHGSRGNVLRGGRTAIASASLTLVLKNICSMQIFPSLIPTNGSPKVNNRTSLSAIGPTNVLEVPLPDGWSGILICGTGCISDGSGARNCTTGNCRGRDCTAEDSPVATSLGISNDGYTMSTAMGYNVGLTVKFICDGCGCPSASCKAHLQSCEKDLRVFNSSGSVVACKPGSKLLFSGTQCPVLGDYPASKATISCPLKNVVVMIEVSC